MESDVSITHKLFDFLAWLKANLRQVILGTVVAVCLVIVVSVFVYNRGQREVRASQALSDIRTPLSPTQPLPPGQAEAYLKVANEYSGTKSAVRALLSAGGVYFIEGKYDLAKQQFERVLKEYPETPFRLEAILCLGRSLEASGKTDEAIAKYEEVRKSASAAGAEEAKLDLARLYEAKGRQVEALKMYDELVKNSFGGLGAEAGMRLEDLTNRVPSLATNLIPPTPVMPPMSMTNLQARMATNRMFMTNMPRATNLMRITNFAQMTNMPRPGTNRSAITITNVPVKPAPTGQGTNVAK